MTGQVALFAVGLAALTLGADLLVRGASRQARRIGMSPLVTGLTVVAFGTSAPELVVSLAAAVRGQAGLAVGNVMGSTVANVGLIVGLGALVRPIRVHRRLLVRESPLLILVLAIVVALSYNGELGRLDGMALLLGFGTYLAFLLRWGREEGDAIALEDAAEAGPRPGKPTGATVRSPRGGGGPEGGATPAGGETRRGATVEWLRMAAGLAFLLTGADWLVDSAVEIATALNVPEEVIGATLVAVGTSLPELASTVVAALRGLGDIAIGNVIGSNVFNVGLVLGVSALAAPLRLPPRVVVGEVLPALAFCLLLVPLAYSGGRVDRVEGAFLLAAYGGFLAWIL